MSPKHTAKLIRLVPKTEPENKPCSDTIETLTWLLQEAIAGRITGLAYGAMQQGKRYIVDSTGEAFRDPLRGIGLAQLVSQKINDDLRIIE